MSEELLKRGLEKNPEKIGTWDFYNIGSTTVNQLKKESIIRSVDYGEFGSKKVDGIIMEYKKVIAIVENKLPENFNTPHKKKTAVLQEIEVAKKLKTKLIIATDGQESLWVNVETGNEIKDEEGKKLSKIFNPKDSDLQKFIKDILQSIDENNDRILPRKFVDPTNLAKKIWQDVWSVSGATPENCLYTFVELFIFKYLSDLGILTGIYNFDSLWKQYENNKINDVLKHYANFIREEIKELFPKGLDGTTIINGTIFVNKNDKAVSGYSAVFRKVLEKFKDYGKLENIDRDFKSKLFESFLKESISKKNWGQFFTPLKVVRAINKMAEDELKEDIKICDPACGVGKFPLEFVKEKLNKLFIIEKGKIVSKVKIIGFDKGFDKDEQKTIILAKANMLIYFSELIKNNIGLTKEFAEFFNKSFVLKTDSILGTLSNTGCENEYDLILTNPPYVTSGSSNLKKLIKEDSKLRKFYKTNATGVEGLFVEWIVKSLKPNGKAFMIIPDGILNRQNDKKIRQFILNNCYIDAIISLPEKTFFTTQKKTYVLAITKKNDISERQTNPVFTYLVSEIGESRDIHRFDIEKDDLNEAVILFQFFKGNKKEFYRVNSDKRCKLQAIEKFRSDVYWSVDRWWTEEEKIELEIIKKEKVVGFDELAKIVKGVSDKLNYLSISIKRLTKNKEHDK